MATRYGHTNLIANDWRRLADFYAGVFDCTLLQPLRDLSGAWLEQSTLVERAHLRGAHLRLPGFGDRGPTLEIFQYDETVAQSTPVANRAGFGHIAFVVDDVEETLARLERAGGSRFGDVVSHEVPGAGLLTFTYARDPEGNLVEIQRWDDTAPRLSSTTASL